MIYQNILLCLIVLSIVYLANTVKKSVIAFYNISMKHAMISNFSRFGDWSEQHYALSNYNGETRGFFMRDGALWICEVLDGALLKTTAKPIDMYNEPNLKEVLDVVEALTDDHHEVD